MLSITNVNLPPPAFTGALWPTKSPLWGSALPDLDTRALTTSEFNWNPSPFFSLSNLPLTAGYKFSGFTTDRRLIQGAILIF
jgi:hypothetical protein